MNKGAARSKSATPFARIKILGLNRWLSLIAIIAAVLMVGALTVRAPSASASSAARQDTPSCANPVACENQKQGTPQSDWDVGSNDSYIQGFADPFSVNVGGTINFKIQTVANSYTIDIYRMGYYGGDGARLVTSFSPSASLPQIQPACVLPSPRGSMTLPRIFFRSRPPMTA